MRHDKSYKIESVYPSGNSELAIHLTYKFDKLFLLTDEEGKINCKELTAPDKEYFNIAKIEEKDGRVVMHVEIEIDKPKYTFTKCVKERFSV